MRAKRLERLLLICGFLAPPPELAPPCDLAPPRDGYTLRGGAFYDKRW